MVVRTFRCQKRDIKRARCPFRGSWYADYTYTDYQHEVLLARRQHFRRSYTDFCKEVGSMHALLDEIGLRKASH
jgi:hypothetical protein